jgi:hypothetical protein
MKWMEHLMAGIMCFGGGVLLATVFIHMLPEVSGRGARLGEFLIWADFYREK